MNDELSVIRPVLAETLWAGTELSLNVTLHQLAQAQQMMMRGVVAAGRGEDEDGLPPFLSMQGDVAVISVAGGMIPKGDWFTRFVGMTDYEGLREAAIHAATKTQAKAILLDVQSGGGAVSGLFDTADLLAKIDKELMPIYTYAGGDMMSAAYALGVTGRRISASRASSIGSIGVVATHKEYSKALKDAGIGVTVVRAGEFKALVNMYEPLSEKALAQLQESIDVTYGMFTDHVAAHLKLSATEVDKIAQGREFVGAKAQQAGLVDKIESFDDAMSYIQGKLDKGVVTHSNIRNVATGLPMKTALTEQQIAAIAAGAPVDAATTAAAEAAAAEAAAAEAAAAAAAAAAAIEAAKTPAAPAADVGAAEAFLRTELAAANEKLVDMTVANRDLKAQVDAMKASHDALVAIAGKSLSTIRVALGMQAVDVKTMSVESLLAEHASASEQFQKTFPVGGVAAVNSEVKPKGIDPATDPIRRARVGATSFNR